MKMLMNREDTVAMVLRIESAGLDVAEVIENASKIDEFVNGFDETDALLNGMQLIDVVAERDRARETAARLEQELAEKQRELDTARSHMVKGALLMVLAEANGFADSDKAAAVAAVGDAAEKLGVTL